MSKFLPKGTKKVATSQYTGGAKAKRAPAADPAAAEKAAQAAKDAEAKKAQMELAQQE